MCGLALPMGRGSKVLGRGGKEGRGGGAVYMTASVPIHWAWAVMRKQAFSWAEAVSSPSYRDVRTHLKSSL